MLMLLTAMLGSYVLGLLSALWIVAIYERQRERACVGLVLAQKRHEAYQSGRIIPFAPRDAG